MYTLIEADLLFVMGTSLTVYPFAALSQLVPQDCPRVLINFDEVGDLGERAVDVLLLDDCDETVQKLCDALGWGDELKNIWDAAKETVESPRESTFSDAIKPDIEAGSKASLDLLKQVEELTEKVGLVLNVTEEKIREITPEKPVDCTSNGLKETVPVKDVVDSHSKVPKPDLSFREATDTSENIKDATKL